MKLVAVFFSLVILVCLLPLAPLVQAETVTQTRYMDSDYYDPSNFFFYTYQVGTSYRISETQHNLNYRAMQIGLKVYVQPYNESVYELTTGIYVAIAEIPYTTTSNITAMYNGTWTPPLTNLTRQDQLQIAVYKRVKSLTFWGSWTMWTNGTEPWDISASYFMSESLGMDKLLNETWTAHYWIRSVKRTNPTLSYWWAFLFGDTTYNTSITNMSFENGITPPIAPLARFTFTPNNPNTNEEVTFNAATSTDPDGTITAYTWSFGDGTSGSGSSITKTYPDAGTYSVALTVTDDDSATNTMTHTILVTTPPSDNPPGGVWGNITLTSLFGSNTFSMLPIISTTYTATINVTNTHKQNQWVTIQLWINRENTTVWNNTKSELVLAETWQTIQLAYPINQDGAYVAYAQIISPTKTETKSQTFIVTSQLTPMLALVVGFIIFLIAIAIVETRPKKPKENQ